MKGLSAAQKSYIRHLVAKHHDSERGITQGTMSDRAFANLIGVHFNTLLNWQKLKEFQEALKVAIEEFEEGHDYFKIVVRHKALEELWTQYRNTSGPDKRQYLAMILKETEEVESYKEIPRYDDMTTEDLEALVFQRKISPLGMSVEELRASVKKEESNG